MKKAPGGRYAQIIDGVWVKWDLGGNRDKCCGCSLIHEIEFKVVGKEVWAKYVVDQKATNRARKLAGIRIIRKK